MLVAFPTRDGLAAYDKTALSWARDRGHAAIVALLEAAGAH